MTFCQTNGICSSVVSLAPNGVQRARGAKPGLTMCLGVLSQHLGVILLLKLMLFLHLALDIWKPPKYGQLKLNVRAAVPPNFEFVSIGAIIRDHTGVVFGAMAKKIPADYEPVADECLAIPVKEKDSLAFTGVTAEDIQSLSCHAGDGSCGFVPREGIKAAHMLA
ncbi:hypothetical protein TIFTF001_030109 [Ficus carica]|uniref:RNase H type-1 domain-containing protein n=1 Tax=Ficus carica TaxID=3494 RepID=A0AA88J3B0_FICCA|nr:hypothetical protein TIFTF001_030109 [Ficus carica]